MHIFHKWTYHGDDTRSCQKCSRKEGFSSELGRWKDLDFLSSTNYDAGYWLARF